MYFAFKQKVILTEPGQFGPDGPGPDDRGVITAGPYDDEGETWYEVIFFKYPEFGLCHVRDDMITAVPLGE